MGKDLKENHGLVSVRLFRPECLANNHKMKISLLIIMMISIQGSLIFLGMVSQGMPLLHPHDPANAPNAPAAAKWGLWPDNGQDNEDEVNGPVDAAEAANLVQVPIQRRTFP